MRKLIRRQVLRGETPYLHVMSDNTAAHAMYEKMGFVVYHELVVRVVALSPTSPAPSPPSGQQRLRARR